MFQEHRVVQVPLEAPGLKVQGQGYARARLDGRGGAETEGVVSRRDGGGGWLLITQGQ